MNLPILRFLLSSKYAIFTTIILTLGMIVIKNIFNGEALAYPILNWSIHTIIAFTLYFLNRRLHIIRVQTNLLFFFYLFFNTCCQTHELQWRESICAFLFIILITLLFNNYRSEEAAKSTYNIAFTLSCISIIDPRILFVIPIFFITFKQFRTLQVKSCLSFFIGLIVPYWFMINYIYFFQEIESYQIPLYLFQIQTCFNLSATIALQLIILISLIIAIVHFQINNNLDKVHIQLFFLSLFLLLTVCIVSSTLFTIQTSHINAIIFVLITFFLGHYFSLSQSRFTSILFDLLLLSYIIYYIITL